MIYEDNVRDLLRSTDTVTSDHLVVAEWNMNRYQKISKYGLYIGLATETHNPYSSSDPDIADGKTYNIYDDGTSQPIKNAEYFSSLASVFQPDRPDPGIVLLQYANSVILSDNATDLQMSKVGTSNPRFYPFTKNRKYDYFNSSKIINISGATNGSVNEYTGRSIKNGGAIKNTNPFVVYEDSFPCNKIVIKVQNHNSVPDIYYIDILDPVSGSWIQVYSANSSTGFTDGILEIYYNGTSTWTQTVNRLTDFTQIGNPSTQLKMIKGVRLRVASLSTVIVKSIGYSSSLELIEISPRIEADMSSITESFTFNSSLGDSELGLPVGSIVASNGSINISNDTRQFLLSSSAAAYRMLTPDVEFRFYQNVYNPSDTTTYQIRLKTMYSDAWSLGQDFTSEIKMSDKLRLLQDKNVADMCFVSNTGIPYSALILMILDNAGITGYEFKKTQQSGISKEDIKIKTFYCKKEETVAEILQKLAIATQSGMFFDAYGNLNVFTKERITRSVNKTESNSTNNGTDFWMVFDEEYPASGYERSYLNGLYTANVITSTEERIDPITDGTIKYHAYGVKKAPGQSLLEYEIPKEWTEDVPNTILANTGYDPALSILWSLGSDNQAVLGAATLTENISTTRIENAFNTAITASSQYHAISKMLDTANATQRKSLVIQLDQSEAFTFTDYKGYVMIDSEYIAYDGLLYKVNGVDTIFFSKEQLQEQINSLSKRNSSIIPQGLIIDVRFNVKNSTTTDGLYDYTVKGDGRAQFGSAISDHFKDASENYIQKVGRRSLTLGAEYNDRPNVNSFVVSEKYDYSNINNFRTIKKALGLKDADYNSSLGFLKLSGPQSPIGDIKAMESASAIDEQNKINAKVDEKVGNSMAPYVFTSGERNIYMQRVGGENIGFAPNLVATRMKLYSGRKEIKNGSPRYSTNSSIGGMAFCVKSDANNNIISGYFLEVESKGSAAKDFYNSRETLKNNVRFYKIERVSGKLIATVLAVGNANVATSVYNDTRYVSETGQDLETIFNLEVRIDVNKTTGSKKKAVFNIYYNDSLVNFDRPVTDQVATGEFWDDGRNVYLFVRNDSQAIFEYVIAAAKPRNSLLASRYFSSTQRSFVVEDFDNFMQGTLNQKYYNLFEDGELEFKYFDFAKTVREVKKYSARYERPAISYKLIDVSNVNPQYFIKERTFTGFGAELVVVNATRHPIFIKDDSNLPLYIYGAQVEELSNGQISLKDFYDAIDNDNQKITDLAFNKSVYGEKTFNLDSNFIQGTGQSTDLMKWIISNCSRERIKMTLEIYANPLLEVGDKVKVYSKERGYTESNSQFGQKTFVITDISHEVSPENKKMSVTIVEVGESGA